MIEFPTPRRLLKPTIASLTVLSSVLSTQADPGKDTRGAIVDRHNKTIAHTSEGKRSYPLGKSAAHISGYVYTGKGTAGMEASQDQMLSTGKNVRLTIDSELQKTCYDLLAAQKHPGSIVVQDPNTGEILALVSYPSFDPSHFIPKISKENWKNYQSNQQKPLLNRALFPHTPGSITMPLAALAGEHAGLKNPEIHCKGFVVFGEIKIPDWKRNRDERLTIPEAIESSCGTYFMQLAARADDQSMNTVGKLLHLNEINLNSLPAQASSWPWVPKDRPQHPSVLAMSAIGQGHSLITPVDAATMTSAIATGTWHQPHLVVGEKKTKAPVDLTDSGKITSDSLQHIRHGMHLAVHGDQKTAGNASVPGIQIAGIPSTAQTIHRGKRSRNCWFTGYGPYQKPQFTVTVFLSGATSGGKSAAPIASEVFTVLLKK